MRIFAVKDIHTYLGEDSPLTGFYKPHDDFSVTYESWEAMSLDNTLTEETFSNYINSSDSRPLWVLCGSSFADMLKRDMEEVIHDKRIAKSHRHKVILPLQIAQLQMLLEKGLRPQKIFFVLLTPEGGRLAEDPLNSSYISSKGALLYHPRNRFSAGSACYQKMHMVRQRTIHIKDIVDPSVWTPVLMYGMVVSIMSLWLKTVSNNDQPAKELEGLSRRGFAIGFGITLLGISWLLSPGEQSAFIYFQF